MSCITSILLWDLWCLFYHSQVAPFDLKFERRFPKKKKQLDPIIPEQANHPNLNPVSREIISDSVELWETDVCFFTHPTYWNKCMTSKNAKCSSRSVFWIFKISPEVRILKQSQSALSSSVSHKDNIVCIHSWWIYEINRFRAFVTGFGPFCYGSFELILLDHKISGSSN